MVLKKDPASDIDVLLDKENIKYVIKEGIFYVGDGPGDVSVAFRT